MTTQEILAKVASGEVQRGEAATLIAVMNGNGKSAGELTYMASGKGAVSVYGFAFRCRCRQTALVA
jgi:hypothetical protein